MTEKTVKVANYSTEATASLVAGYAAGKTVEALATELGKTVRSVIAKLSKEGVYKAKAKAEGKREMLKAEMVAEISKEIGVSEEVLESLEKATGPALMAVLKALRNE
jgi:molybdopterin converting factor small subunit